MLKDLMTWRYATKAYDPARTLPEDKLEAILEAIRLAPTSSGTQPFEVFVVTNPEIKKSLGMMGMNQAATENASHALVFASWDTYTEERIDSVHAASESVRGKSELADRYYTGLKGLYVPRDPAINAEHAARQAYIALGFAMLAAAEQKVDATPMEGFDPAQADKVLGLAERGLKSQVILTLGYRGDGDWLEGAPKVRKSAEALFTRVA
ncbi:NAD(P)H-dependent oxidoreductase [Sagittula salina]|uniref:NAD(P)H-dependent oxidoreductase n=1 Tax=Sagittula salina TaxID=2820268 RepID=A0A940S2K9_9RHOB|nr:NAD(P)H-dependent oxidoreductase [Sagittula salina]MBP0481775.1 NAD(P)H-dependent oxidoreductase [Sagittula salina]